MFHRFFVLLAVLVVVCGCSNLPNECYIDCDSKFSKVIVTDFTGGVIAEWTAAGKVKYDRGEQSYNFLAVEKIAYGITVQTRRYVIGRPVNVKGANVAVFEIEPPTWICPGGVYVGMSKL